MHRCRRTVLLVFLLLAVSPLAFAHAILVRSTPANQAIVHSRNLNFVLDYNSRIDAGRCTLILTGPAGRHLPLQMKPSSKPSELQAAANSLTDGNYQIHWQVLASDGHITRGDISFTVAVE